MADLIELQRKALLDHINAIQTDNGLKYLVLDETTEFLVDSLIDRKTLLRYVTAVERLDSKRKSKPSIDAVYIIDPTTFSLNCLKTDFKVSPPRYRSMFIYVLPSPSVSHTIKSFSQNNNPIYKLIRFIKVFNFNYLPVDNKVFLTTYDTTLDPSVPVQKDFDDNDPKLVEKSKQDYQTYSDKLTLNMYSMQVFFNPSFRNFVNFMIDGVVNSLLNVCIVTNEYPIIRYYSPKISFHQSSIVSKLVATKLQEKLDDYLRNNPKFNPNSGVGGGAASSASPERSILVIVDRSIDLMELFLHEFNYESMIYDYLPRSEFNNKSSVVFYSSENARGTKIKKVSKLTTRAKDKYFDKYRYLHIAKAYDMLNDDIKKMVEDNPLLMNTSNAKSTTDILHIMAHSQEFNEDRRLLTLHKQLIERFLKMSMELKLSALADLEQTMAADGYDIDGQFIRLQKLTDNMVATLDEMKALDVTYKIRLIVLYVLKKKDGIFLDDLSKLLKFIGVYNERELQGYIQLFKNLNLLNHDVIKLAMNPHSHHQQHKDDKPRNIEYGEIDNSQLNTSRYKPAIAKVISSLAKNNNEELSEFPFANEANNTLLEESVTGGSHSSISSNSTSLRNKNLQSTWSTRSKTKTNRQKIFAYMIGGITPAEIKAAHDIGETTNKDVYLGSEHILCPGETIFNIQNLNNTNAKELNPYIEFKLHRESNGKVPEYLLDNDFPKPQSQQQPQQQPQSSMKDKSGKGGWGQRPGMMKSSSAPATSDKPKEKKHKFGLKFKK
ncbi:Sec1 protein [Saccharomycopsis crataegensis]|uniref:Sec1 protein n=1 Tax=Saccharomycopsis crataegensis TaxID=43959 RepID=A0AAV5QW48_9ASCO|nr:Sec1 protein [Saccharomycopsis crataegensis]